MNEFIWYSPFHDQIFIDTTENLLDHHAYFLDHDRTTYEVHATDSTGYVGPKKIVYDLRIYIGEL